MMSPNNEQISLTTLAQFETALQENPDFVYLKNIVHQVGNNINCQIPDNDHIRDQNLIGSTLLHLARRKFNHDISKYLLYRGIDFTIKNKNGSTAFLQPIDNIHTEIERSKIFVFETLRNIFTNKSSDSILLAHVALKISTNPCNNHGISHFHIACMLNNASAVEFFLQNGASVHQPVNSDSPILAGFSPLHLAIVTSSLQTLEILLRFGADMNCKDSRGITPLHLLVERRLRVVKSKFDFDANQTELIAIEQKIKLLLGNHKPPIIDDTGLSHLHLACIVPSTPMLEYFVAGIQNVNRAIGKDSPFYAGYTPLHFAILFESNLAHSLLKKGADIFAESASGATPFDLLMESNDFQRIHSTLSSTPSFNALLMSDGRTRLLDLVIAMRNETTFASFVYRRSFDVNACVPTDSPLFQGYSTLHLAVSFAYMQDSYSFVVVKCLSYQADLFARDLRERSPLHLAFRSRKVRMVDLLLKRYRQASVLMNAVDSGGLSILHIAVAANDEALVDRLLVVARADIEKTVSADFEWFKGNKDDAFLVRAGSTLLHVAVASESIEMLRLLLRHGANAYATDAHGLTPMHRVLTSGSCKNVGDELMSRPDLEDRVVGGGVGLSHLHVACYLNDVEAVERLLSLGSNLEAAIKCSTREFSFAAHLEGFTPVHIAMREENRQVLRLLLDRGADILARLPDGSTPFYRNLINRPTFCMRFFSQDLRNKGNVLKRIEDDIGLTMLHIACYQLDLELVKCALDQGADVNARVGLNSSIWPDCTPLYLLVTACRKIIAGELTDEIPTVCSIMMLLLDKSADASTMDVRLDSPLHLADEILSSRDRSIHSVKLLSFWVTVITAMLWTVKDFTKNPRNKAGISQFHVACRICGVDMMKKFLDNGCDVHERVDGQFRDGIDGYTPLHLTTSCPFADERKLEAVELLLGRRADCGIKAVCGDTPLHTAARCNDGPLRLKLLDRLVEGGADINARNFSGETPFEIVLKSDKISAEEVTFFLGRGCRANAYNPMTELGYLPLTFNKECYDTQGQEQVLNILLNNCDVRETDEGRTVIHSIVSSKRPTIIYNIEKYYLTLIDKLVKMGCDLDSQDKKGRTALHLAVQFDNYGAVEALLTFGADVNILDAADYPAPLYVTTDPSSISLPSELSELSHDSELTIKNLASHLSELRCLNLDVIQQNINFQLKVESKTPTDDRQTLLLSFEIMKAQSVIVGSTPVVLSSFLSETGIVAAYPTMPLSQRVKINRFFEADAECLKNQFPELKSLLRLQYRKAVKRMRTMDSAKSSLQAVFMKIKGLDTQEDCIQCTRVGHWLCRRVVKNSQSKRLFEGLEPVAFFQYEKVPARASSDESTLNGGDFLVASRPSTILPEPCCETILRYLTSMEIDNLIAATDNRKT